MATRLYKRGLRKLTMARLSFIIESLGDVVMSGWRKMRTRGELEDEERVFFVGPQGRSVGTCRKSLITIKHFGG